MTAAGYLKGLRVGLRFASIARACSSRPGTDSAPKMPGNVLVVFGVAS
jgi:hypothetical protein